MRQGQVNFSSGEISVRFGAFRTDTIWERMRGLLALPTLTKSQGLWIEKCHSVHSFGMQYALDLVYLDKRDRIIKIVTDMPPRRCSYAWRAASVIELLSGESQRLNLQVGMQGTFDEKKG